MPKGTIDMQSENISLRLVESALGFADSGLLNFDRETASLERKIEMLDERITAQPPVAIDHLSSLRPEIDNLNFEKRELENKIKYLSIDLDKKKNALDIERTKLKKIEVRLSVLEGQLLEMMGEG